MRVPQLGWHLPGDLVGAHGLFVGLLPVTEEVADVDQGKRNAEPHGAHRQHRGERDGAAGMFVPDEEVDEEPQAENDPGVQRGGEKGRPLPLLPF